MTEAQGPLANVRVLEFAGIGPVPFATMLLADMGASVIRIDRADADWPQLPIISRGRAALMLDLKSPDDLDTARQAVGMADVLIEGFRPGAMERLGLGPETACAINPRLIYARMTGWGQDGPRATQAGHDLNYLALSGMLAAITPAGRAPSAPLNLLGDYAGGSLFVALGILAALFERERSGRGQVIDAAIVDGAATLLAPILGMMAASLLPTNPADGMLGGNAPIYRTYACADGQYVAVGPLEPRFQKQLAALLNLPVETLAAPDAGERLAAIFMTRSRDEWVSVCGDADTCLSPVLHLNEAPADPHLAARGTYRNGREPGPTPRFLRTPGSAPATEEGRARMAGWKAAIDRLPS